MESMESEAASWDQSLFHGIRVCFLESAAAPWNQNMIRGNSGCFMESAAASWNQQLLHGIRVWFVESGGCFVFILMKPLIFCCCFIFKALCCYLRCFFDNFSGFCLNVGSQMNLRIFCKIFMLKQIYFNGPFTVLGIRNLWLRMNLNLNLPWEYEN